jgi:hypothetical protein
MGIDAFHGLGGNTLLADGLLETFKRRTVWNKGRICPGFDPTVWRYDDYGNPITFGDYDCKNWSRNQPQPREA